MGEAMRIRIGAGAALAVLAFASGAAAQDRLSYFTWLGYELPEFDGAFLAAHPDGVEASIFSDDDEAFTKVRAGFRPDVAHPCYDKIARWRQEDLLQPIDTARIRNWSTIFPVFQNLPDIQAGEGQVWMVPWDWGNTSILYRTDMIENPEQSWSLLWNPEYAGRMATIDAVHDTPVVAAILAGLDPFTELSDEQMALLEEKLREQRPLLRAYTTDLTSVEQSLASGELVAAMTWNASATTLKRQGVPVEFLRPAEGMLTWACGFVLLKDSPNVDLAYDFINSRLEAASGKYLIEAYGYGSASSAAFAEVDQATLDELSLPSDPEQVLRETVFTGAMPQNDAISQLFERIKAGG